WARHGAVAVLVVLGDADAVPAQPLGGLELVEILVGEPLPDHRVVVAIGKRDPRRRLVVLHRVRHQMEVVELHRALPRVAQNSITAAASASGSSRCGTCPDSSKTRSTAPGISFRHASAQTSGASRSWAPQQSSVGVVMRARRRRSSGLYRYGFHSTRASAVL